VAVSSRNRPPPCIVCLRTTGAVWKRGCHRFGTRIGFLMELRVNRID
jgi:hypothetical protein